MKTLITFFLLFSFTTAFAEPISSLRDWTAEKDVDTVLGHTGCVAETVFTDADSSNWHLQVIKLRSNNGEYAVPVIMAFPEATPTTEYQEAVALSDKMDPKDSFKMTLLQPDNATVNPVGSRMTDKVTMLGRLRADNKFTVTFLSKDITVGEIPYSLSGSSKTIRAMDTTCQ